MPTKNIEPETDVITLNLHNEILATKNVDRLFGIALIYGKILLTNLIFHRPSIKKQNNYVNSRVADAKRMLTQFKNLHF